MDEAGKAVSLCASLTGVHATVFVLTKPAPRWVEVAIDPADGLNLAKTKTTAVRISDGHFGGYLPPQVEKQVRRFLQRNRDTLLRYWDLKISTPELLQQLKAAEVNYYSNN